MAQDPRKFEQKTYKAGCTLGGGLGDTYLAMCYLKLLGPAPITVRYRNPHPYYISLVQELFTMMPNVTFEVVPMDEEIHPDLPNLGDTVKLVSFAGPCVGEPGFPKWNIPPKSELPKSYSVLAPQAGRAGTADREPLKRNMHPTEMERALRELEHPVVLLGDAKCPAVSGTVDLRGKTSLVEAIGIVSRAKRFTGEHGVLAFASLSQKVPSCLYIQRNTEYMPLRGRMMKGWIRYCTDVRNHEGK
jgi:hypothetical protein